LEFTASDSIININNIQDERPKRRPPWIKVRAPSGETFEMVREIMGNKLKVGPLEAIDGTPIVDSKPVLAQSADS
jgi:tRNA (Thr-GGU) A37 N-methylase